MLMYCEREKGETGHVMVRVRRGWGRARGGGHAARGAAATLAALVPVLVVVCAAGGRHGEEEGGVVRLFSQEALYEVEARRTPAFVKLDPAGCGGTCLALARFWESIALSVAGEGVSVWNAPCTEPAHQAVCKDRAVPYEVGATQMRTAAAAVIDVDWIDVAAVRRAGLQHLSQYLNSHVYLNERVPPLTKHLGQGK